MPGTQRLSVRTHERTTWLSADLGVAHLHIDSNVLRQSTDEQTGLLLWSEVIVRVAKDRIVALGVLLDCGLERQTGELR